MSNIAISRSYPISPVNKPLFTVVGRTIYLDIILARGHNDAWINKMILQFKEKGITQIELRITDASNETAWEASGSPTFSQIAGAAHRIGMNVGLSFETKLG